MSGFIHQEYTYVELMATSILTFILLYASEAHIKSSIILHTKENISFFDQFVFTNLVYLIIFMVEGLIGNFLTFFLCTKSIKFISFFFFALKALFSIISSFHTSPNLSVKKIVSNSTLSKYDNGRRYSLLDKISFDTGDESEDAETDNDNEFIAENVKKNMAPINIEENGLEDSNNQRSQNSSLKGLILEDMPSIRRSSVLDGDNELEDNPKYEILYILIFFIFKSEIFSLSLITFILLSANLTTGVFLATTIISTFLFYLLVLGSSGQFDSLCYIKVKQIGLGFSLIVTASLIYYI